MAPERYQVPEPVNIILARKGGFAAAIELREMVLDDLRGP